MEGILMFLVPIRSQRQKILCKQNNVMLCLAYGSTTFSFSSLFLSTNHISVYKYNFNYFVSLLLKLRPSEHGFYLDQCDHSWYKLTKQSTISQHIRRWNFRIIFNPLIRNVVKWSDTLEKSCSKCCITARR